MDDAQEASWRASGQHLKLQWLSPPTTALVVFKPVPAVRQACVEAVAWLAARGMTVYVEPGAHAQLLQEVQRCLEGGGGGVNGGGGGGGGGGGAAADLSRQLLTWEEPPCGCPPAVPCSVGHQCDLVLALGGDGTVLWTCGLFAAGAVPPIVPFAMGSLGFMTPFQIADMHAVLRRVTALDRGVPLMLRHRLQVSPGGGGGGQGGRHFRLGASVERIQRWKFIQ
jgi:NAD+ kinase